MRGGAGEVGQFRERLGGELPAVPAEEAAEIDAEAAESEDGEGEGPGDARAPARGDRALHVGDRGEGEEDTGRGAREEQCEIEPERHAGTGPQMDEVGRDVGRI